MLWGALCSVATGDGRDGNTAIDKVLRYTKKKTWRTPLPQVTENLVGSSIHKESCTFTEFVTVVLTHLVLFELRPSTHSAAGHVHHLMECPRKWFQKAKCVSRARDSNILGSYFCLFSFILSLADG